MSKSVGQGKGARRLASGLIARMARIWRSSQVTEGVYVNHRYFAQMRQPMVVACQHPAEMGMESIVHRARVLRDQSQEIKRLLQGIKQM